LLARRIVFAILILALLGLLARAFISGLTAAVIFHHPFQLDESEGMIVAETMLLDHGENIYRNLTPDFFISTPYPPLFYLLTWPFQHFAGDEPTFKPGRLLSMLATLLAGLALFGIVRAVTRDKLAAVMSAAAWWSLALVVIWGSMVKPDMLGVALGLAGMWVALARPGGQVWWALPLFVGAFYTKQTAIAAVVATVSWLLFTRRWKLALLFGGAYAVLTVLPSFLLNMVTDGGYFYHLLTIHDLPWFPERFLMHLGNLFTTYGLLLAPGLAALVLGAGMWLRGRLRRDDERDGVHDGLLLASFYGIVSVAGAVGAGTLGGNHNHLLDIAAAGCLGLGLGIGMLRNRREPVAVGFAGALGIAALLAMPWLWMHPDWLKLEYNQLSASKVDGMRNVAQYVTNNSGQAYSDNVGLLLSAGKRLWTTDPYTQTHATLYKRWDESKLVEAVRRKEFSQIILRYEVEVQGESAGDLSPALLQAVLDNYKLDQRNVMFIYEPK
jgi:hypothetical protein